MKLKPLNDRIVVKRVSAENMSKGGILIPDNAQEKPEMGEVVAVGPGKPDAAAAGFPGGRVGNSVHEGDKVLFGKYSGQVVKVDGDELLVMREEDILAIIA